LKRLPLLILLILTAPTSRARGTDDAQTAPDDGTSLEAPQEEGTPEETTREPDETVEEPRRPEPVGALWRSGVIAGWGQFYNEKYIKGIILFGLEALTVYGIVYYADAAAYELRRMDELGLPDDVMSPSLEELVAERDYHQDLYENYRVDYETHVWLTVLVVVYSMLDAYVDAHLADFETGEELGEPGEPKGDEGVSLDVSPYLYPDSEGGLGAGLSLSLSF
jgi:hypothetical protein